MHETVFMPSITDAHTLHLIYEQAVVENSIDYDFLVSLFVEIDLMIQDMEKNPSPLKQYHAVLSKLNKDRSNLMYRLDELQEQEVYLAEYFAEEYEGPDLSGSEQLKYFITGDLTWSFTPHNDAELQEASGESWGQIDEETVWGEIQRLIPYWHKSGETEGTEYFEYGKVEWNIIFSDPRANT